MIYCDDCLNVMRQLADASVDLIYLDPPFYTQRNHQLRSAEGKEYAFSDIWKSRTAYLDYMRERLMEMRRILKDSGNLFLQCDTSASHYLRILLDEVFGEKNFRSEIIWSYKRWSNSGRGLIPNHQTIYYYSKSDKYQFHTVYTDYSPTTNLDQILQERMRNENGKAVYKRDAQGEIVAAGEKKGVPMSDVWEIPFLNPKAKERTGYPTQKPLALLDRIIEIGSDIGDTVLDPFCGSGTTLVSAKLLGRKYIGVDRNPEAVQLTQERLNAPVKSVSNLMLVGEKAYRTKTKEELAILQQFDCNIVQRNKGIDALLKKHYMGAPVAVRIQKEAESFSQAVQLLQTAGEKRHCSYTVLIAHATVWEMAGTAVPDNMVVLQRYDVAFEENVQRCALDTAL